MQLPDLDQLHPWLTPALARRGIHEDWLEPVVVHSLIAFLADQVADPAPEEEVEQERSRMTSSYHLRSQHHLSVWCELRGLENEQLTTYLSRSWRWRRWVETSFEPKLESIYLLRQDAYTTYVLSILQLENQGIAEELYLRILDDAVSFESLARRYSIGREASSGGVLGPVLAANLRPALLGVVQTMQPGDLMNPFLMDDQWVIVRLEERRTPLMDDTMRRLLLEDHSRRWLLEQARERIAHYLQQDKG